MGGHKNGNNGKTQNGREPKMQFNIFTECHNIHDEMYTFDSKYYEELRREALRLGAKPKTSAARPLGLRLVVDNTRKNKVE
jgi:hypothetical protein